MVSKEKFYYVSIYKITFQSKDNNTYYYIGKSKDVDKRFNDHLYNITHFVNSKFYNMVRNMGIFNTLKLSIIEEVDESIGRERETYWIQEYFKLYQNFICNESKFSHNFDDEEIRRKALEKSRKTQIEKYGALPVHLPKSYETNRANHGGVLAINTPEIMAKSRQTLIEKYGSCLHTSNAIDKMRKTLSIKIIYNGKFIEYGINGLYQKLVEDGYKLTLSMIKRLVTYQTFSKKNREKYPELLYKIFVYRNNVWHIISDTNYIIYPINEKGAIVNYDDIISKIVENKK